MINISALWKRRPWSRPVPSPAMESATSEGPPAEVYDARDMSKHRGPRSVRKIKNPDTDRWEFNPRYNHVLSIDRARQACRKFEGTNPRVVYPVMKDASGRRWMGRNQPRTLSFTATPEQAEEIQEAYGTEKVFIWNRKELRYL